MTADYTPPDGDETDRNVPEDDFIRLENEIRFQN